MTKAQRAQQEQQALKARYLAAVGKVGTLTAGCRAAKVSPHTVYKWREFDLEFSVAEQEARNAFADELEEYVVNMAKADNVTAAIFLLKAIRPEKYRERIDVNRVSEPLPKSYAGVGLDEL